MSQIMSPVHPEWSDFLNRLSVDLQKDSDEKMTWTCFGDYRHATAILETIPGIDIEQTLIYFSHNGGHCDCEILLNLDKWEHPELN